MLVASEWEEEYVLIKHDYKRIGVGFHNWVLTKADYLDQLTHGWLWKASDFVKDTCKGERELVPLDLNEMIWYSQCMLGYPKYAWPPILFVKDNGAGEIIFLVE